MGNALTKVKDEKGMKRVEKFLRQDICPSCHGTCVAHRQTRSRGCLPHDARKTLRVGRRDSKGCPCGYGADGTEHLRDVPSQGGAPDGPGARLSHTRPRGIHAFYGGASAHVARTRRVQSNDGCALRSRRAVHRTAPCKY